MLSAAAGAPRAVLGSAALLPPRGWAACAGGELGHGASTAWGQGWG